MKVVEMMKFGKGYYVTTRLFDRTQNREWFKTKTAASTRVRELKKLGYKEIGA